MDLAGWDSEVRDLVVITEVTIFSIHPMVSAPFFDERRHRMAPLLPHHRAIRLHVGQRILTVRQIRKLSVATVATHINVSPYQVRKYEKGEDNIHAADLYAIAILLDVPVSVFFDHLPKHLKEPVKTDEYINEFIAVYWMLPPHFRQIFSTMVKACATLFPLTTESK